MCRSVLVLSAPLSSNSRVAYEIERTLRRGADVKHGEVEKHKPKIQDVLDIPNAAGAPLDKTSGLGGVPRSAPVNVSGSGASLAPFHRDYAEH